MSNEKREFVRLPVKLTLNLREHSEAFPERQPVKASDLSEKGLFIHTNESFNIGDSIAFDFFLNSTRDDITISGVVRHVNKENPQGIGVQITTIDEQYKDEFLEELCKHAEHVSS